MPPANGEEEREGEAFIFISSRIFAANRFLMTAVNGGVDRVNRMHSISDVNESSECILGEAARAIEMYMINFSAQKCSRLRLSHWDVGGRKV